MPERAGIEKIWSVLPEARLVGGCVRDFLCGRTVHDIDLASPLPPEEAARLLENAGLKVVPTGIEHGTITAIYDGRPFEITTLRRDVETDGRHAVVSWTDDWREDAARRDFTINALSFDRQGKLHDYFGGVADLSSGRVRFVGDACRRLEEDALRALRFFRFQARYGLGAPDAEAARAIREKRSLVKGLSVERIASELLKILSGPSVLETLRLMEETGLLAELLPDATLTGLTRLLACDPTNAEADRSPSALTRLFALCPDPSLGARLKLSRAERTQLHLFSVSGPELSAEMSDDALRRAASEQEPRLLVERAWLRQAALCGAPDPGWTGLRARLKAMTRPVFPLSGRDGLACGLAPGEELGVWLKRVRDWWLSEGCRPDAEACRAWLAAKLETAETKGLRKDAAPNR